MLYERFTDRARKVLQIATQVAHEFNHEYLGVEHVLLGILKEGIGIACQVLKNLEVDSVNLHNSVYMMLVPGPSKVTMGKLPQTPRLRCAVEQGIEYARESSHNYVGTEHLLIGIMRSFRGHTVADGNTNCLLAVLCQFGITEEKVDEEIKTCLGLSDKAEWKTLGNWIMKTQVTWLFPDVTLEEVVRMQEDFQKNLEEELKTRGSIYVAPPSSKVEIPLVPNEIGIVPGLSELQLRSEGKTQERQRILALIEVEMGEQKKNGNVREACILLKLSKQIKESTLAWLNERTGGGTPADRKEKPMEKLRDVPEGRWTNDLYAIAMKAWDDGRYPNPPNNKQTKVKFLEEVVSELERGGICLVWKVPNKIGETMEVYVLPAQDAVPFAMNFDFPRGGYSIRGNTNIPITSCPRISAEWVDKILNPNPLPRN